MVSRRLLEKRLCGQNASFVRREWCRDSNPCFEDSALEAIPLPPFPNDLDEGMCGFLAIFACFVHVSGLFLAGLVLLSRPFGGGRKAAGSV